VPEADMSSWHSAQWSALILWVMMLFVDIIFSSIFYDTESNAGKHMFMKEAMQSAVLTTVTYKLYMELFWFS
jgi:hypothetical protein